LKSNQHRQNWAQALSIVFALANIIFFPVWREIFTFTHTPFQAEFNEVNHFYFYDSGYLYYLGGVAATVGLAALIFLCWYYVAERYSVDLLERYRPAICGLVILYGMAFISARTPVANFVQFHLIISSAILIAVAWALWVWRGLAATVTWFGIRLFVFVGVVIIGNGLAATYIAKPAETSLLRYQKALAPLAPTGTEDLRVLWLIFDEWDQKITFDHRKPELKIPTIDAMRENFFAADFAREAGLGTLTSVPTMIMGETVTAIRFGASDKLFVKTERNDEFVPWRKTQNLFREVHDRGINSAILTDSFLSFCRQFHDLTAKCWENGGWWDGGVKSLADGIYDFSKSALRNLPYFNKRLSFGALYTNLDQKRKFEKFLGANQDTVTDPEIKFAYIHWLLPHDPYYYDSSADKLLAAPDGSVDYWDSLVLVDKVLSNILKNLDDSNLRKNTVLLVTSDHGNRAASLLGLNKGEFVPFMVSLPNETSGFRFKKQFSMVAVKELILNIYDGKIRTNKQLADFLSEARWRTDKSKTAVTQ